MWTMRAASCRLGLGVFALVVTLAGTGPALAEPETGPTLDNAIDEAAAGNTAAAEAQQQIDALSGDIDALVAEYGANLQQTRALDVYAKQLEDLLASQRAEMQELREQIEKVTVVGRTIMPLLAEMVDTLDQFVSLDVPFLPEERTQRIAGLREMMGRADVTISEKYRRVLEAYQIENEYGRTIEAYRGPLAESGKDRTVDFLRVGRLALLYQTLDGQESGMWDAKKRAWVVLGGSYYTPIQQGLRIARKQAAPDLITIPVQAPENRG
jgi:hypothetical protein